MKSINSLYRNSILPRMVFIPYWITKLLLIPFALFRKITIKYDTYNFQPKLCIESGIKGWELIDYKELYATACEYIGEANVFKVIINKEENYISQVKYALGKIRPTHYFYDPRTGSQNWVNGLLQSFRVSVLLYKHRITPICLLTDLPVRTWRTQCGIVSANSGVVISLMSPRKIHRIFPHDRLVSPTLMPLSEATMNFLAELYANKMETNIKSATFIGSLYEPRTTILRNISEGLKINGYTLEMKSRSLGSERISDFDYWSNIINATIIITTAEQIATRGTDWTWFPHLIYRYIEVCACGTLLIAPEVPGIQRFLTPGVHFVTFTSPANAVEVIEYYLTNIEERKSIAQQGRARIQALVSSHTHWIGIDIALGKNSLI